MEPRSTRSKNRQHMSGKPRLLTLLIQGKEACIVKLSSLQPHPRLPLPPSPSMESKTSLEQRSWGHQACAGIMPGTSCLSESCRPVSPTPQASSPLHKGLDPDTASRRVPGLPGRKSGSGFKPQNNSAQCRHREQA